MGFSLLITIIGYAGGLAVLLGFAGVAAGRLGARSSLSHAVNCGGGVALALSAACAGAWPSFTVNVIWSSISAAGLVSMRVRRRPAAVRYEPPTAELSIAAR